MINELFVPLKSEQGEHHWSVRAINMPLLQMKQEEDLREVLKEAVGTKFDFIRATRDGILYDYTVDTDIPELVAAMMATVFGAASYISDEITEGGDPFIKIKVAGKEICVTSSHGLIVGAYHLQDDEVGNEEIQAFIDSLPPDPI